MSSNVCLSMPARASWLVAAAVAAALVSTGDAPQAEIYGTSFRSAAWGIELTVPRGWELSEQSSYPGLLARGIEHRGGARLSIAAARLSPDDTARSAVARSERSLKKLGYNVAPTSAHPFGALLIEAVTPDKKRVLRQAYLAQNGVLYILTLASPAATSQRYVHIFDETLRSLRFSTPESPVAVEALRPDAGAEVAPDASDDSVDREP